MAKFEPKIEHFFLILSSENVSEGLRNHPEYLEEILYYTGTEQKNAVLNAFQSARNKREIFRGLGEIMPISSELIKHLLAAELKTLKGEDIAEVYKWLQDIGTPIVNYTRNLRNYVDSHRILSPYETRSQSIESTLAELREKLSKVEEYNQQYAVQKAEQEALSEQIAALEAEQKEGYWEQKKQELNEIRIQLEQAKEKYTKDCKQLKELQKELDDYQSGAANKNVSKYLKTLQSLSKELPKDEVN